MAPLVDPRPASEASPSGMPNGAVADKQLPVGLEKKLRNPGKNKSHIAMRMGPCRTERPCVRFGKGFTLSPLLQVHLERIKRQARRL